MKLAVTGKGGVGKTTVTALLAGILQRRGHRVTAIDADPDSNLAACMGYVNAERIEPLVRLQSLIEERTGVKPGTTGGMFLLNPFVADIPDRYAVQIGGVRVLVAGAVKKGGTGCYCPENALVRALVSHLLTEPDSSLILDMEAGIEHLGRGTVAAVDRLLVVVEPSRRSVETALRIRRMAGEIKLQALCAVGNKIRTEQERTLLQGALPDLEFAGFVPWDEALVRADLAGRSPLDASERVDRAVEQVADFLEEASAARSTKGTA